MIRRRVVARGLVQGVFFRDSCRQEAERAGVSGWVRNADDGTLEAAFEGQEDAVQRMVAWVRHGPPQADVTSVDVANEEPRGERGFTVR